MYVHLLLCSAILGKPYKSTVKSNNNDNNNNNNNNNNNSNIPVKSGKIPSQRTKRLFYVDGSFVMLSHLISHIVTHLKVLGEFFTVILLIMLLWIQHSSHSQQFEIIAKFWGEGRGR